MTRAFTTQYAKDAAMDNSRLIFDKQGNLTGWTDTAGTANPLPVDFRRVSAATCGQYRAHVSNAIHAYHAYKAIHVYPWPDGTMTSGTAPVSTDEQTMTRVDVRQFHRDQRQRDEAADRAEQDRRDFWFQVALITVGCLIGGAGYALLLAV